MFLNSLNKKHKIKFIPDNITIEVEDNTSLLQAINIAGINIVSSCGGKGTCGACKVIILEDDKDNQQKTVLACKTLVNRDMTVEIPTKSRLQEHQVLTTNIKNIKNACIEESNKSKEDLLLHYKKNPFVKKIRLKINKPSLTDNTSDWTRLQLKLKKVLIDNSDNSDKEKLITIPLSILKNLALILRQSNWDVSVTLTSLSDSDSEFNSYKVIKVEKGNSSPLFGLAIDIGTTTVVVSLINISTGEIIDTQGTYNKQVKFGDDVITRIIYAVDSPDNMLEIQKVVIETINELIDKILSRNKYNINSNDIVSTVVAGNTIMTQLFLGINPKYIRLEPYIPTINEVPLINASEIELNVLPESLIHIFPSVASYIGGDIVSGVLVTDMSNKDDLTLFIDIGTNGEIVLGNKDWLVTCASSAGTCFEGGGINSGMRAMSGAIERIDIDTQTLDINYKVIGDTPPIGICGSGLVDCLAKLRKAGIIDRTGNFQFQNSERYKVTSDDKIFVLAWSYESGTGKDIIITENDVKNLIRAKGAIYAGIRSLLNSVGIEIDIIKKIIIAGGFGNYLNIKDSIQIGLLPDLQEDRYNFIGNSSLKGAILGLLSQDAWKEALELSHKITNIELSVGNKFMDEFVSALFLPHTDLTLFPSVEN